MNLTRTTMEPLRATLARVAARSPRWRARVGWSSDNSWLLARAVPGRLATLTTAVARAYDTDDVTLAGTFFLTLYARTVVGAALVALVTERRVPDIAVPNVALRLGQDGIAQEIALATPRVALLPDDPDAAHGDAVVVADVAALRQWLRARYLAHIDVLVAPLGARTRRGPHALWATASDVCSGTLAAIEGGDAEARAFLDHPPLLQPPPVADRWRRLTCCLAYRLPGYDLCASCPCR